MIARHLPLALVVAVAVACSGSGGSPDATPSVDRVEAIRQARQIVEQPAVDLGSSALTLSQRVERLASIVEDDLEPALDSVTAAVDDLRAAAEDAAAVDLDPSTADIAEAAAALQSAAASGEEAASAGDTVVSALARGAEIDVRLAELVAGWEERGSRRQLLDHFAELADAADELADDVEAEAVDAGCSAVLDLRVEAARTVASATRELRELIANYRGNEYDVRQPELSADPFGLGVSLFDASQDRGFCPLVDAVGSVVVEVTEALDRMQGALAPDDL